MVPQSGGPDEPAFPAPRAALDPSALTGYPDPVELARRADPMSALTAQPVYPWEVVPAPRPAPDPEPDPDPSEVERLACRDVWRVGASSKPAGGPLEPLSAAWFQHLDSKRYRRHGRWMPALLEFTRHAREEMLAVGDGLGLDWVRYAEGGANVTVVDP